MQSCNIIKANHTGFTVSDPDKAVAFFRDVLGFSIAPTVRQSGRAVEKITGVPNAEIEITFVFGAGYCIELLHFVYPVSDRCIDLRACDAGFAHIAFEVDNIDAMVGKVEAAGYRAFSRPQIVPAGPRKGGKTVYTRGPDGIVIEFQQAAPLQQSL
jgi:catechol 2,3-dioxygenase-like lactoylglutathione lyase family enzyme